MNAHEIWSAAQLAPGEGIEDGVARIEALMQVQDAAAQAREKVLRNHFAELAKPDRRGSYQWFRDYAARALAQPTDDSALKAALIADRRKCIDIVRFELGLTGKAEAICLAIRALGD